MKTVKAHIEQGKDGSFGIYTEAGALPFLVIGDGKTLAQAKSDFSKVWDASLRSYSDRTGKNVAARYSFVYDTPSFLQEYKGIITLAGLSKLTGINKAQLSHYMTGKRRPSAATHNKIKTSVHHFATQLECAFE
jgi:hypothetical protein